MKDNAKTKLTTIIEDKVIIASLRVKFVLCCREYMKLFENSRIWGSQSVRRLILMQLESIQMSPSSKTVMYLEFEKRCM